MYKSIALDWIAELQTSGKLPTLCEEEKERLAVSYSARIEDIINQEALDTLAKMGKAEEYERMKLFDGQYLNKYLNQTLPGFFNVTMEALQKATEIIKNAPQ